MLVGSVDVALVSSTTSPDNRLARASLKSKPMLNSFCFRYRETKIEIKIYFSFLLAANKTKIQNIILKKKNKLFICYLLES